MFEKTKYEPVISRDGESCVYRTVDRSLSMELEMDTVNGFNCPGYEFRLCQNPDELRNIIERRSGLPPKPFFTAKDYRNWRPELVLLIR